MTARERRLVRTAELAALNPSDAPDLLASVVNELRSMNVPEADRVLASMTAGTARLVCIAALRDLDRQRPEDADGPLRDLLARHERSYVQALERELQGDGEACQRANEIAAEVEQQMAARHRHRDYLARMHARRGRNH
jgi:hypothetical protein